MIAILKLHICESQIESEAWSLLQGEWKTTAILFIIGTDICHSAVTVRDFHVSFPE